MTLGDLLNVCVVDHDVTIESVTNGHLFQIWTYDIMEVPVELLDHEVLRVGAMDDSHIYVKLYKGR